MNPRLLLGLVCLVAGVPLAAWSLAAGRLLPGLAGFALVFTFIYLAMEAMGRAGRPQEPLKKAADVAWSMKDSPPSGGDGRGGQ
jgi:hypothetical protein